MMSEKAFETFEDELDAIRLSLYEEVKDMTFIFIHKLGNEITGRQNLVKLSYSVTAHYGTFFYISV